MKPSSTLLLVLFSCKYLHAVLFPCLPCFDSSPNIKFNRKQKAVVGRRDLRYGIQVVSLQKLKAVECYPKVKSFLPYLNEVRFKMADTALALDTRPSFETTIFCNFLRLASSCSRSAITTLAFFIQYFTLRAGNPARIHCFAS